MNQMKEKMWKGIKAIVIAFVLFVVMIPVTNVWADVGSDNEPPVITNVTIDKKGQYVESGEVTITVDVVDESGLSDTAYVILSSPIEDIDDYKAEMNLITMSEDGKSATYGTSIDVGELSECEWYIDSIEVTDIYDNGDIDYGYVNGVSLVYYEVEYYFYVYGEDFIEDNKINEKGVIFELLDKNGTYLAYAERDVPRRVKLGDIFGDKWVEKLPDDEKLGNFLGWVIDDKFVTKDSMIFMDSYFYRIKPKYEKKKVSVSYHYLYNRDARLDEETIIIEEDTTYGELMDMIEFPKAEGYTFTGWSTSYDEEAIVKENSISLYAEYDKYPIHLRIAYLDENGVLNSIDTIKDYSAAMTYNQILNECNPNVDKWLQPNMECNYDAEISIREALAIEAVACYENKQIVQYEVRWIKDSEESKEYGEGVQIEAYMVVDKENASLKDCFMVNEGTALLSDSLIEIVKSDANVDHFDKLTVSSCSGYAYDYNDDEYLDHISMEAFYENSMVNLRAFDNQEKYIDRYYSVKPGEVFYFPEEYEGQKVYWLSPSKYPSIYYTGSYTIPAEDEIGEKYYFSMETELPEDAILHENPSKPSEPEKPAIVEGWKKDNVGWWYQNADGTYPSSCWKMISGKWYAFDGRGYMREGWFYDAGKWYYLIPGSGQMATGWIQVGGTWYYMNSSGVMATGWVKDGNTWYYMKSSGAMATGWVKDGGTWYYMKSSGAMATGWVKDGNTWYYMKSSGAMATGWVKDGNTWYYMKSSGAMATGWILDGGTWYYLNSNGAWVA